MAKYPPLWNQAISYPAQLDRQLLGALWPTGGVLGGVASAVANTLQVSIAPGSVAVPLQAGQGAALCHWDAAELVTLDPGPGAGTTRVDLIVAQVRDNAIDGGPSNDWLFAVVKGTPAALLAETREEDVDAEPRAVAPAVPQNSLAIAQVTVLATAVNLNTATITDRRPGGLAVGGVIGRTIMDAPTQITVDVGGTFGAWDAGASTVAFVGPPSGRASISFDGYAAVDLGASWQGGWQGGGITPGKGAAQCPVTLLCGGFSTRVDQRMHLEWFIQGLTPGLAYAPMLYSISTGGHGSHYYYGGAAAAQDTGVGPLVITARAA